MVGQRIGRPKSVTVQESTIDVEGKGCHVTIGIVYVALRCSLLNPCAEQIGGKGKSGGPSERGMMPLYYSDRVPTIGQRLQQIRGAIYVWKVQPSSSGSPSPSPSITSWRNHGPSFKCNLFFSQ